MTKRGEWHGEKLAGDRWVGGAYVAIPIVETAPGVLEGHSEVLEPDTPLGTWEPGVD